MNWQAKQSPFWSSFWVAAIMAICHGRDKFVGGYIHKHLCRISKMDIMFKSFSIWEMGAKVVENDRFDFSI